VIIAIAIGLVGGACSGYWSGKALAFRLSKSSPAPGLVVACAAVGALLMSVPAFFLSFVLGGNVGGAWGEAASIYIGFDSVGVPFGIAVGIAFVLGGSLAAGALLGGLLGKAVAFAMQK
jgi:hypothetical protein